MVDPTWEYLPKPGTRYSFDLAVAHVASEELARRAKADEAALEAGSTPVRGVDIPTSSPASRPLDLTVGGGQPFTRDDYRTPSEAEIDASIDRLAVDERFGGAVVNERKVS